jgi:prepilin-type N-terminal cleavage/methylation domain-containing protein
MRPAIAPASRRWSGDFGVTSIQQTKACLFNKPRRHSWTIMPSDDRCRGLLARSTGSGPRAYRGAGDSASTSSSARPAEDRSRAPVRRSFMRRRKLAPTICLVPAKACRQAVCRRAAPLRTGFTLIELLVAIALIAMLVGGIGAALRNPDESVALQAAQGELTSLLNATRGRAASTRQNARLVISADPADAEKYLRRLQVVWQDPTNPAGWLADNDAISLPPGAYVVPSSVLAVPGNPAWPAERRSTALPASPQEMTINGVAASGSYYVSFTPRGTTGGGSVVLTIGRLRAGSPGPVLRLDDPDNVRGVLIRSSGALTLLNDAGAF